MRKITTKCYDKKYQDLELKFTSICCFCSQDSLDQGLAFKGLDEQRSGSTVFLLSTLTDRAYFDRLQEEA